MDLSDQHPYQHDQNQDLHHASLGHQDPHWYDQNQDLHHGSPDHQDAHWLDSSHSHFEDLSHLLGHTAGIEDTHWQHDHNFWSDLFNQYFHHYQHFNVLGDMNGLIGNPKEDMHYWHQQNDPHSCALASADFVVSGLTGIHIPESTVEHIAVENGWHLPGLGTPLDQIGKLVESFGFEVRQHDHSSLMNLENELTNNHKVIVGVNAEDIWFHNTNSLPLEAFPGIPGQKADHAVEVIGVDLSDQSHPMVILNDPGIPDGQGVEIPLDVFSKAWATSGNFMVATTGQACVPPNQGFLTPPVQEGTLEGYSDQAHHWEGDDTDNNPWSDNIVLRY